jgi:hypothetical protein
VDRLSRNNFSGTALTPIVQTGKLAAPQRKLPTYSPCLPVLMESQPGYGIMAYLRRINQFREGK